MIAVILEPDPVLECFGLVVEAVVRRDDLAELFVVSLIALHPQIDNPRLSIAPPVVLGGYGL